MSTCDGYRDDDGIPSWGAILDWLLAFLALIVIASLIIAMLP